MKRFYCPNIIESRAVLTGQEKEHCVKVLRTTAGEKVEVTDGQGNLYAGSISFIGKREVVVDILERIDEAETMPLVDLACAIPKNSSRWEWILEKSVEIGVRNIYPIIAKRSEKQNVRVERAEGIMSSALKQSGRLNLPILHEAMSIENLVTINHSSALIKMIAHCVGTERKRLSGTYKKGENALILIGPEGDFTDEEVTLAMENGFLPVSLGDARYRVETAAILALCLINDINYKG